MVRRHRGCLRLGSAPASNLQNEGGHFCPPLGLTFRPRVEDLSQRWKFLPKAYAVGYILTPPRGCKLTVLFYRVARNSGFSCAHWKCGAI
jgi:hypothetical protein